MNESSEIHHLFWIDTVAQLLAPFQVNAHQDEFFGVSRRAMRAHDHIGHADEHSACGNKAANESELFPAQIEKDDGQWELKLEEHQGERGASEGVMTVVKQHKCATGEN